MIVWIDDEPSILKLMGRFFSKRKIPFYFFSSGQEFFESFKLTDKFILFFIDKTLDTENGECICREIKHKFENCYIILTSGCIKETVDQSCCDEFIQKPWSFDKIEELVFTFRELISKDEIQEKHEPTLE